MQKSSDEYEKKIFQLKLRDFEADIPEGSSEMIFSELKRGGKSMTSKLMIGLLLIAVVFTQMTDKSENSDAKQQQKVAVSDAANVRSLNSVSGKTPTNIIESFAENQPTASASKREKRKTSIQLSDVNDYETQAPGNTDLSYHRPVKAQSIFSQNDVAEEVHFELNNSVVSDSAASDKNPKEKHLMRFRFGLMPLLSYNRIVPNTSDAIHLSNFKTPSGLSSERVGFKISAGVEYPLTARNSLIGDVSYFQYNTQFSYSADEMLLRDVSHNVVDESIHGVSLGIGARHDFTRTNRMYYVQGGADLQYLFNNTTNKAMMLFAGVGREWPLHKFRLSIQPTIHYSLTRFRYDGVRTQPTWIGINLQFSR